VAEHEVVVLPSLPGREALGGLALLVRFEGFDGTPGEPERSSRLLGLDVTVPLGGLPDVDDAFGEVDVVPGDGPQFAGAQSEGDREDEQRFQPQMGGSVIVEADL
jgi:hypothetical protein